MFLQENKVAADKQHSVARLACQGSRVGGKSEFKTSVREIQSSAVISSKTVMRKIRAYAVISEKDIDQRDVNFCSYLKYIYLK